VGQIGSVRGGGGRVVSILSEDEAEKMEEMARELKFDFVDVGEPLPESFSRDTDSALEVDKENVEELRQRLEDTMTLLDLAEDIAVDLDQLDDVTGGVDDNDDDDDDEDEEDDDDEEKSYQ
jgi:hypothetical protein